MTEYAHVPVLLNEVLEVLEIKPAGIYLDATFGRGGHSRAILERLGPQGRLYALDRDPEAVAAGQALEAEDPRFKIRHARFSQLKQECESLGILGKTDGILMDIGVSSPQLDDASRGFSFEHDGPLDMRMDPGAAPDAATIVNTWDRKALTAIFREYGEERFAAKAAAAIVRDREREPFKTTGQLAALLNRVIPGHEAHKNKATRCFQALRIAVNGELDELRAALEASAEVLSDGGRLCVITFHSLEDRIAKNFIKEASAGAQLPKGLPVTCEVTEKLRLATATLEPVGRIVKASAQELAVNARSRSATLRVARRLKRQ